MSEASAARPSLNHLHLHVRDVGAAARFYGEHFQLREHVRHGEIRFLRDGSGFDLALAPDPAPRPLPEWFHLGFRLESGDAVRACHRRMTAAGVAILKPLAAWPDHVTFQCADPDGYRIEVYWE